MNSGPLNGCVVVELAGLGPAPFATMMLAEMGAEVIRIDRPSGTGYFDGMEKADLLNRGKKSVLLDLKAPEAAETVLRLVETADVLVEGFRPGVAERLGLGPDVCLTRNPRLVYGRMTGWGQQGPLSALAGHDINYISITGVLDAIGPADGPPQVPLNLIGDFGGGGMYLVAGVLAALRHADHHGEGQVVDAAIVDGASHLLTAVHSQMASGAWKEVRGANMVDGGAPYYGVYETSDRRHMAVGAIEPAFYVQLGDKLGIDLDPKRQHDREHWPAIHESIAKAFSANTLKHWSQVFADSDACVSPVLGLREAADHPQIQARNSLITKDGFLQSTPSPKFSATPTTPVHEPHDPGADNLHVLGRLGLTGGDRLMDANAD